MTAEARTALLLATLALGLAGCQGEGDARALDRICGLLLSDGPACEIVGVGKKTSGVTGDSLGFAIEDATLLIHLVAVPDLRAPDVFEVSLLTAARTPETQLDFTITWGSCVDDCPANPQAAFTPLPTEFAWVTVASGVRGSEADAKIPYDAVMTFTGVDLEVADLRIHATP